MIMALTDEALRELHEQVCVRMQNMTVGAHLNALWPQFRSRVVYKEYRAIVYGNIRATEGLVR
jgi:hypothetical protein